MDLAGVQNVEILGRYFGRELISDYFESKFWLRFLLIYPVLKFLYKKNEIVFDNSLLFELHRDGKVYP